MDRKKFESWLHFEIGYLSTRLETRTDLGTLGELHTIVRILREVVSGHWDVKVKAPLAQVKKCPTPPPYREYTEKMSRKAEEHRFDG